ncbi:hypothetical protein ABZ128_11320 [Streptomyces sp. NPDC006326]|uniref:hypothetical protein n=1 Tax=Streptomyces sp. NPDC006326 TaxID=3156752 RepID=UPI0033B5FEB5
MAAEWDWTTAEFGDAHAGAVGVLLADGSEPGPVYFDIGSGSHVPSSTHWSVYDGHFGRPLAAALRAACACGWRAPAEYPLDWEKIGEQRLHEADIDLTGPLADWTAHLSVIRHTTAPLPESLAALLVQLADQLQSTATDSPLAALRALGVLERPTARAGQEAAGRCVAARYRWRRWRPRWARVRPRSAVSSSVTAVSDPGVGVRDSGFGVVWHALLRVGAVKRGVVG